VSLHPQTGSYISIHTVSVEIGSLMQKVWSSSFSHMVIKIRKLSMAYFIPQIYQIACQQAPQELDQFL
tara:strand:+ start:601 stop:804 length:204 start_codon:yes stop_codon:yes gene_type:complete